MDCDRVRKVAEIASALNIVIRSIGDDPDREGLLDTPERFARAVLDLTRGYHIKPKDMINDAIFNPDCNNPTLPQDITVDHREIVLVKDINIASLCEHHFLPFFGKAHIGYLPKDKVLGISKLARIADIYARRLQIQERLTRQVAYAIQNELEPHGVFIVVKCSHMCMSMRGTQQTDAITVTQCATGIFQRDPHLIDQVYTLLKL